MTALSEFFAFTEETGRTSARVGRASGRVFLLDDEASLVSALRRQLRSRFTVDVATDPHEALQRIACTDDLAVVVSDMRMPSMNGAEFLSRVRELRPDAVRILLTGYAEIEAAVAAVNQGQIFRFLWKPIPSESLVSCLNDALRQYQLVTAERQLLETTLRNSVKVLADTLSMATPRVFTRASRITRRLVELAEAVDAPALWEIEIAGLFANIGAVTLPPGINECLHEGGELAPAQQLLVDRLPMLATALLSDIPRLDDVRRIIRFQDQRFDGHGNVIAGVAGDDIPIGARLLRLVTDYDALEARGTPVLQAVATLEAAHGLYDPRLLGALTDLVNPGQHEAAMYRLSLAELCEGMILAQDLEAVGGKVLCGRGQEITAPILARLRAWSTHTSIREPIAVF